MDVQHVFPVDESSEVQQNEKPFETLSVSATLDSIEIELYKASNIMLPIGRCLYHIICMYTISNYYYMYAYAGLKNFVRSKRFSYLAG